MGRGKAIKIQFQGPFFFGFSLIQNWKTFCLFVCGHAGNIALFSVGRNKMLLSIDQNRKPFLFSLSHSSVSCFTPGWAFPLGIPDISAIKHTQLLFAVWIFMPLMRHPSKGSPWPGIFWDFVLCKMPCAVVTHCCWLWSHSDFNVLFPAVRKCQERQLRTNPGFLFPSHK